VSVGTEARRASRAIARTPEAVVRAAGQEIKRELERLAKTEVGGDLKMSNLPNIRVGAKVEVTRFGRGALADVTPSSRRANAPWRWLEDGTKAHRVPRDHGRLEGKPKAMKVGPGSVVRTGPWQVRGVRGRRTWSRAGTQARASQAAARAFDEEMRRG
jgi:hypothetical protein